MMLAKSNTGVCVMKKHLKNFSLVLSGVVLGVAISFSGEISAATSKLLGGKVGKVMTVTLDNKKIGEAPVIGGTSYVPVRTAANELGLEVKVSGNEIELTTPTDDGVLSNEEMAQIAKEQQAEMDRLTAEENTKSENLRKLKQDIETAERKIFNADNSITVATRMLEDAKSGKAAGAQGMDPMIQAYEEEIESATKNKAEQQIVLADLKTQLAVLEK